ncbi:MAG TPA: M20/M25/M40 family metallo-hydrolase [Catenuloplanes sp.]
MADPIGTISAAALRGHVRQLTAHGPRHRDNPAGVRASLDHLTRSLSDLGYPWVLERYGDAPDEVNIVAGLTGTGDRPALEIGAHWDSVADCPGADDNASGVAGLLELARVFAAADPPARTLRFCVFGGEENPAPFAGSRAHVARLDADGPPVDGVIVLEMIAYRDRRPGTQTLPADMAAAIGDPAALRAGDFIAALGNVEAADYLAAIHAAGLAQQPALPVLPLSLPVTHTADGARSDHYPYWLSGRKGVMVTDTANFRNPHYHQPTDTLETLDFAFAESVTRVIAAAVQTLSR